MGSLKMGDQGREVMLLQQQLCAAGYPTTVDGDFGPDTKATLIKFQTYKGLLIDGIAGPKVMEALQPYDKGLSLTASDIQQAADLLGVDCATVQAVKAVESRGSGFLSDGRVVILYERHVMKKRLVANGISRARATELEREYPQIINRQPGGYKGGATEHYRLSLAERIHETSALESCSWGLFQIMGYHWQALGYDSVQDFVGAMQHNEGNQLGAFVQFILNDRKLHQALQAKNWATFARRYNGPGYKKNRYDTKLADAYAGFTAEGMAV